MRFRKLVPISFINPAYDAGFFDLGVGGLSVNPWLAAGVRWVGTIAEGAKSCRYRLHDGWYAVAADAPVCQGRSKNVPLGRSKAVPSGWCLTAPARPVGWGPSH